MTSPGNKEIGSAELAEAFVLCAISAGISGTIAWAVVNHFWPGSTLETHSSLVDLLLQSRGVSEFIGNVVAIVFFGTIIALMASLMVTPVAILVMLPAFLILRAARLAHPAIIAAIGGIAGTLYFWRALATTIPFYSYQGNDKLAVAALIGGVGGLVGGFVFSWSLREGQ